MGGGAIWSAGVSEKRERTWRKWTGTMEEGIWNGGRGPREAEWRKGAAGPGICSTAAGRGREFRHAP